MINLNRIKIYREVWKQLNLRYSVQQIGETVELIEATQEPYPGTLGYEIWQKYQEVKQENG